MRLYFFIFSLWFIPLGLIGQNLIINGDFEWGKSDSLYSWQHLADTPDYINLKEKDNNSAWLLEGYVQTNQGNDGFMGVVISNNASESFQQKLKHKLEKGKYYKLSCDVLASMLCQTGFETVTMALTPDSLQGSEDSKNYNLVSLNLKPKGGFINHGKWTNCAIIFKSNGKEQFLSIGNFNLENSKYTKSTADTQKLGMENTCRYIIYDNIKLEEFVKNPSLDLTTHTPPPSNKIILEDLLFESGSSILKMKFQYKLNAIYDMIKDPMHNISIIGYTDNIGTIKDNKILSENRARAVKTYLVNKGYDPNKIVTKGLHENNPIMSNATEAGRRKNRRVEILILNHN